MKIKIMLPDRDGKPTSVSVSALKIGKYFAIHRDIRWARNRKGEPINRAIAMKSGWTITHLATGYAALNRIKFSSQAAKAARRLEAVKAINWKQTKAEEFRKESAKLPEEIRTFVRALERTTLG
jgi:hypothetical protein